MYALIHEDKIQVGPRQWHRAFFNEYLDENNIQHDQLPLNYEQNQAIIINETTKIVKVADPITPSYNQVTEQLAGPFYDLAADPITATYTVADRDAQAAKNDLKSTLASNRYIIETKGTKATLQGQEVTIETGRDDRNIWFQSFVLLLEGTTQRFKFPVEQIWLDLTKADIGTVVQTIVQHVQSAFDWEAAKVTEIDNATTKLELEAISVAIPEATQE